MQMEQVDHQEKQLHNLFKSLTHDAGWISLRSLLEGKSLACSASKDIVACFVRWAVVHCGGEHGDGNHSQQLFDLISELPAAIEELSSQLKLLVREDSPRAAGSRLVAVALSLKTARCPQIDAALVAPIRLACRLGHSDALATLLVCTSAAGASRAGGARQLGLPHKLGCSALSAALHNSHAQVVQQLVLGSEAQVDGGRLPPLACAAGWASTLRMPRRQPGAGGCTHPQALTCVALILAVAEPHVRFFAQHSSAAFAAAPPGLPARTHPETGGIQCSLSLLHRWHAMQQGTGGTGRGCFVHVQMLRGLDAPTALFWVAACSGFVKDGVKRLARGTLAPSLSAQMQAVVSLCAAIARLHPAMVYAGFGEAASAAARLGSWRLRRVAVLRRLALRQWR